MQSLKLAYSRAVLLYLSINICKFHYWSDHFKNISRNLYNHFNNIINNLLNLTNLQKQYKNKLVPAIKYNKNDLFDYVLQKIRKDELKFKYKWNKFGCSENMKLLDYLIKQKDDWILNEKTLNDIFVYFDNKYHKKILQTKCFQFGMEYNFE